MHCNNTLKTWIVALMLAKVNQSQVTRVIMWVSLKATKMTVTQEAVLVIISMMTTTMTITIVITNIMTMSQNEKTRTNHDVDQRGRSA